jgi:DNA repair protein RadC
VELNEDQTLYLQHIYSVALQLLKAPLKSGPIIASWDALLDFCHANMAHSPVEMFHIFYLDRKNRLIEDETMARGTVDHVSVYSREILRRCIQLNASAVILAHNHPSGDPMPSASDISMTKSINKALAVLEITLHDHVIIGSSRRNAYSFRTAGLL